MLHPYLKSARKSLAAMADPERAAGASAYMRHQFIFFGIPMPALRAYARQLIQAGLPAIEAMHDIVDSAWEQPEREFQYLAIWLLRAGRKEWNARTIQLAERMITRRSWWDTVDAIASDITGPYFLAHPDRIGPITGRWNRSKNIWLQRSSLLFQKAWKKDTDKAILSAYILHVSGSREFFVQKAIGWSLREYAKSDPAWVRTFLNDHEGDLPALGKREARKHIG